MPSPKIQDEAHPKCRRRWEAYGTKWNLAVAIPLDLSASDDNTGSPSPPPPTTLCRAATAAAAEPSAVTESRSHIRMQGTWRGVVFEGLRRTCGGVVGRQMRVIYANESIPTGVCQRFLVHDQ